MPIVHEAEDQGAGAIRKMVHQMDSGRGDLRSGNVRRKNADVTIMADFSKILAACSLHNPLMRSVLSNRAKRGHCRAAIIPRVPNLFGGSDTRPFALLSLLLAVPLIEGSNDWPGWRGPSLNGVSPLKDLPTSWSSDHNISWKVPVPGRGHSSPVVWGTRIFLTTDLEGDFVPDKVIPVHTLMGKPFRNPDSTGADHKHTLQVLCYDAATGREAWARTVYSGEVYDEVHRNADYATSTPVTDGKYVYASFGAEGYYKLDFGGHVIWKANLGKIDALGYGYGPSPVLYDDKVIVLADQDDPDKSFIAALAVSDGKVAWKTPRKVTNT